MNNYKAVGVMSGTSLDGVDIAYCIFSEDKGKWLYRIECAETAPYDKIWKETLGTLENSTASHFIEIHKNYGHFLGKLICGFITKNKLQPDLIASHGHTVFHQPEKQITCQIGDGAAIAAECGIPVVCDFRSGDVAFGGQGAPLVPIGDKFLFPGFEYCLNLGGFANISYEYHAKRIAFDISPVNIVLNRLASLLGKDYDNKGRLAASGKLNRSLLSDLNGLGYYHLNPPKSLGREWLQENIQPVMDKYAVPVQDKLYTFCEHIGMQVSRAIKDMSHGRMIITGGGAYNDFLISRIRAYLNHEIFIPDNKTIEFKEALIFAFLGVLRMRSEINCFCSVTGASRDSICGAVYLG